MPSQTVNVYKPAVLDAISMSNNLAALHEDDLHLERHPLCTQCIAECVNRIAPDLD
jgi:hypothetical protein